MIPPGRNVCGLGVMAVIAHVGPVAMAWPLGPPDQTLLTTSLICSGVASASAGGHMFTGWRAAYLERNTAQLRLQ
jgi:hypothetical protein